MPVRLIRVKNMNGFESLTVIWAPLAVRCIATHAEGAKQCPKNEPEERLEKRYQGQDT